MRNSKRIKIVAAGAALTMGAGVAFAYWTTSGFGEGTGTTTAGEDNELEFATAALTPMFPGDTPQPLTVTVTNGGTQDAYVTTVKAYIETDNANCGADDFLLNGVSGAGTPATAEELTWTPQDLVIGGSDDATGTIQFHNRAHEQNACKDVEVTIHYLAS